MYKSKFLQNVLGEHSSKVSKVGFEDFEDTTPKGFSEKTKSEFTLQDYHKSVRIIQEPEYPPDAINSQTYFGMSPYPCIKQQRLKKYWSILGDCTEERKEFHFKCENEQEADELKKLTWTLVFQLSDRWKVELNGLELRAVPPPGKEKDSPMKIKM